MTYFLLPVALASVWTWYKKALRQSLNDEMSKQRRAMQVALNMDYATVSLCHCAAVQCSAHLRCSILRTTG
jgi:hypothetical protein